MSLFGWFSGTSAQRKARAETDRDNKAPMRENRGRALSQPRSAQDTGTRSEERKIKRHARREQLYQVVRDAMTFAGVLSASYQFKVLSLDQVGDQFLVMMDVERAFASQVDKLGEIETRIVQTAKIRFKMEVTAVYWRIAALGGMRPTDASPEQTDAGYPDRPAKLSGGKKPTSRYEPVRADEVTALKQALAAAVVTGAVGAASSKLQNAPHSYTLLTGFEDTEMAESGTAPALSSTQYGELN